MNKVMLPSELYREIASALREPFRFERSERFALREVMRAAEHRNPVDRVCLEFARDALARHRPPGKGRFTGYSSRMGAAA